MGEHAHSPSSSSHQHEQHGEASAHLRRRLRDDETLLETWRQQPAVSYFSCFVDLPLRLLALGLVLAGPWVALLWVAGEFSPVAHLETFVGIWLGLWVLLGFVGFRSYQLSELGLTDDRLIELGGVVGRDASSVVLDDIQDVELKKGLVDEVFGVGGLRFKVAGGDSSGIRFTCIEDPHAALERIEDARKQAEEGEAA